MDKSRGVYLMLQVHVFDVSEVEFLDIRGLKQKFLKREKNRKLN